MDERQTIGKNAGGDLIGPDFMSSAIVAAGNLQRLAKWPPAPIAHLWLVNLTSAISLEAVLLPPLLDLRSRCLTMHTGKTQRFQA